MIIRNKIFLALVFSSFIFISCQNDFVIDEFKHIPKGEWHQDSIVAFTFDVVDTLSVHNMYINNRISGQYPYSKMYLFVHTIFPDNREIKDTLACILAEQSGRLLGKRKFIGEGFGNIYHNQIPFKTYVRFPKAGIYTIKIEQGMRDIVLPEVYDVGISVEKVK